MSLAYPAALITKASTTPTNYAAGGIWTMSQVTQAVRAGLWPGAATGDPYFNQTTLLLQGQGTNGAQNNTFLDSSSNAFTITRNGNTTQGTFSPFSEPSGYWGTYFDGSGDFISVANNSAVNSFSTGDFTIECWFYYSGSTTATRGLMGTSVFNTSGWTLSLNELDRDIGFTPTPYANRLQTDTGVYELNQWNHVAVTRASGTITIWVNGVSRKTGTNTNSISNTAALDIGQYGAGWDARYYYEGYLSNVRIVKGAALYTSNFTPSTSPLTTSSQGANPNQVSLLTCQSNRFVDNSNNAFTFTVSGDPRVVTFQPFGSPTSTYSATTVGGSGYFDDSGDYLTIAANAAFNMSTGDFTWEGWAYIPSDNSGSAVFSINGAELFFRSTANGQKVAFYNASAVIAESATSYNFNEWNHVAVTRSGTTLRVYLNGVSGTSATHSSSVGGSSSTLYIGVWTDGSSDTMYGYLSNARIVKGTAVYTGATLTIPTAPLTNISGTSLLLSCTNAGIYDSTGINDLETISNAQVSTASYKYGASSIKFNGSSDYIVAPGTSLLNVGIGDFTIEGWFNTASASTQQSIINAWNNVQFQVELSSSGKIQFAWAPYSTSAYLITGATTVTANAWNHFAIVRSGSTFTVYLNGNADGTGTSSATTTTNVNLWVGANYGGSRYFNGYLEDLRITKGIARYTQNFTVPQRLLPNYYLNAPPQYDPYYNQTPLLLPGTGTNGGQNNTFLDSSTNAFTITRNGNTTQGTFSPFSQPDGWWSNYFDGSGDYLNFAASTNWQWTTNSWTIEMWVYNNTNTNYTGRTAPIQLLNGSATTDVNDWSFGTDGNGKASFYYWIGTGPASVVGTSTIPLNTWTHVAATYDGSSTIKIYVNGTLETTGSKTGTPATSTSALNIGAGYGAYYNGYISNLRIVKGSVVYSGNFTPSTTPLTAITNTQILTCQSNRFVDNSSNAFAITVNGDTSVQSFFPFVPTAAFMANSVLANGGSGYFDRSGDYLSVGANSAFTFGTGDYTIECWVYSLVADGTNQSIWTTNWGASGSLLFTYDHSSVGSKKFGLFDYTFSNSSPLLTSSSTFPVNQWNYVAISRSGSTVKMFVNGSEQASATQTTNLTRDVFGISSVYTGSATETFSGYISGLRVLKGTGYTSISTPTAPPTAITNTSLLCNFTNASIADASGRNDLETVGNAQISNTTAKFGTTSMYFDGTGDWLTLRSNPHFAFGTGDFTIEAWVYPTSTAAVKNICGTRGAVGSTTAWNWGILTDSSIQMYSNGSIANTGANTVPINTWTHVAFVRYSGTIYGFINGIKLSSASNTQDFTVTNFWVGVTGGTTEPFFGYIQDLRITKGIARYQYNFTPPTAALPLY